MLKYLRLVFTALPKICWLYFGYIVRYARHPEKYPLEKRYKKVHELFVVICDHLRIDWKIKGLENIRDLEKKGQVFLLVPNHLSVLDTIQILYWCEKPVSVVSKKENLKLPVIGKVLKAIDSYHLDRNDLRDGVRMIQYVSKRLSEGSQSFMIFPEGTRNKNPKGPLNEFHPGSFKSLYKSGVPMIPLAQYGSQFPLSFSTNYKRYPMYLTFFKPIVKEEYSKYSAVEFAPIVEEIIAKEVYSLRALGDNYFLMKEENIPLKGKKAISIQ